MSNSALYLFTVLIWGSTWWVITFQLGVTPAEVSVAIRFLFAGLLLIGYCLFVGRSLRFPSADHLRMAGLGILLFGVNYALVYLATGHIPSGLVAVVFSTITVFNTINATLFLKRKSGAGVWLGGGLGCAGIALIFLPSLSLDSGNSVILGLALALASTMFASLGNTLATAFQNRNLPVAQSTGFSMLYGGLIMTAYSRAAGLPWEFDFTWIYLGSLAYLAAFGSVAAFLAYLTLMGRIGPEKASYAIVLTPVVALAISTVFESYTWSLEALLGAAIIVLGNVIILRAKSS